MLVLSRKVGEQIRIDDVIELTVLEIRNDRIRLGFCGPREVPIHREEVHRRIVEECAVNELEREAPPRSGSRRTRHREAESKLDRPNRFAEVDSSERAKKSYVKDEACPGLSAAP